ncbi:MAG: SGNH/GDSL hydrolase family protein [Nitrospira sp.]|nr:MAG: SGNH/GDSL hydrolase family protein [Nitrospira sp.]
MTLKNSPVVENPASRTGQPMLIDMVLGSRPQQNSLRQQLEARSYLFRLISETVLPTPGDDPAFEERHGYALRLFWALFERLQRGCSSNEIQCVVALMAGSSLVESPSSLSAQFQDFFRRRLAAEGAQRRVVVIDVANELRARYRRTPGRWFHPNEGHLNAEGHRVVATILQEALSTLQE